MATTSKSKKEKATPEKQEIVAETPPIEPQVDEFQAEDAVEPTSYDEIIAALLSEVAQVVNPYIDEDSISMVAIVAVSANGAYSDTHEVKRLPQAAGDDEREREKIERVNASARLQVLLQTEKYRDGLIKFLQEKIS